MAYLNLFERKILKIFRLMQEKGKLRLRYNEDNFIDYQIQLKTINISRIIWGGQIEQMDENKLPSRIMECKPKGVRGRG